MDRQLAHRAALLPPTLSGQHQRAAVRAPLGAVSIDQVLTLQRLAGNRAVAALLGADPPVVVQRGIRKPGAAGLYTRAPAMCGGEKLSVSVKLELQNIITKDKRNKSGKHFTLRQAVAWAKRQVKKTGNFLMNRAGKRLKTAKECEDCLTGQGLDMTIVGPKLTGHAPLWNALFGIAWFVEDDFKKVTGNGQAAYCSFTQTVNSLMPRLAPQISGFNEAVAAMVKAEPGPACAMKGSMFERWTLSNVLASAGQRIRFKKQGNMGQDRSSDGYDPATGTLWDMKHYTEKMAASTNNDQAADYDEILTKGYKSITGQTISAVNYLFPTLDAAKANKWLASTYGFGVYYVEDPTTLKQHA
ncbi:MAG TPA: hypothetical protein VFJ85_02030 [Acidimicrobiales bacterium]|nr:hypothetical protein [Acidimicrobiales bacterium]